MHLLRDIEHAHCGLVITEPRHAALLEPIADRLPPVLTSTRFADDDDLDDDRSARSLTDALAAHADAVDLGIEPDVDSIWALIFTSGTSDSPKAVICSQRRLLVTGKRMSMIMDLGPDDIGYVCMPLFHSERGAGRLGAVDRHAVHGDASGGVSPRRVGCPTCAATARRTSTTPASRSRTCSPNRSQPDDAENTLRVAFGNEGSPEVVGSFADASGSR